MLEMNTKARTLSQLFGRLSRADIVPLYFFEVEEWSRKREWIIAEILKRFSEQRLIVRSSARIEDSKDESYAGAFKSIPNVCSQNLNELEEAIDAVIASYFGDGEDEVLIQPMLNSVAISGVITSRVIDDGAPYYVLNYDDESGRTDMVTGGKGVNKTVLIHRATRREMIQSERVARWFEMMKELEALCRDTPIDVEFAELTTGELFVLQVRPIAAQRNWRSDLSEIVSDAQSFMNAFLIEKSRPRPGVLGRKTTLGEMPDWNPAEMIGTTPSPLAVSLYRRLITDDTWRLARAKMGYRSVENEALMFLVGGKPYIDVRNSFNSFLPGKLPDSIGEKVVNIWLEALDNNPQLHDKIEFEVATTVADFSSKRVLSERYASKLEAEEIQIYSQCLRDLTSSCLRLDEDGTLRLAERLIEDLYRNQSSRTEAGRDLTQFERLVRVSKLLDECKRMGTFPFAIIARHAFIAESFLQSLIDRGVFGIERMESFKRSLGTIASTMSKDFFESFHKKHLRPEFMKKYGHLRPGTYDILSLRYDQRPELFSSCQIEASTEGRDRFLLDSREEKALSLLLREYQYEIGPELFLEYCRRAISGREWAKFVFTKNVSDALELLAQWGETMGLNREEISFLPVDVILDTLVAPVLTLELDYFRNLAKGASRQSEISKSLHLGYLLRSSQDLFVVPLHRSAPNFTTRKFIEGQTLFLNSRAEADEEIKGKIVCIENADPGYDWIFTRGIAGLITKFGGKNSHMAIRCAELGLPAAIGCGEQTFERLVAAGYVELNCGNRQVRPIYRS